MIELLTTTLVVISALALVAISLALSDVVIGLWLRVTVLPSLREPFGSLQQSIKELASAEMANITVHGEVVR